MVECPRKHSEVNRRDDCYHMKGINWLMFKCFQDTYFFRLTGLKSLPDCFLVPFFPFFFFFLGCKNGEEWKKGRNLFDLYLRLGGYEWMKDWSLVVKLDTLNICLSSVNKLEILLLALYVAFTFCCYFIPSLSWMVFHCDIFWTEKI